MNIVKTPRTFLKLLHVNAINFVFLPNINVVQVISDEPMCLLRRVFGQTNKFIKYITEYSRTYEVLYICEFVSSKNNIFGAYKL